MRARARAAALAGLAACALSACAAPKPKPSPYELGLDSERHGSQDQALADLSNAVDLDPSDPVAREALAELLYRRGWISGATQAWEKALAPNSAEAAGDGSKYGPAAVDSARRLATAALLRIYLARGASDTGDALWTDAAADYQRVTQLDPDNVTAWPGLAEAAGHLGDKNLSYLAYQRSFGLIPGDPDLARGYGYAAHGLGKLDESALAYARYTALRPDDAEGWNNAGTVLVELGRYDEALACFDKALALQPALIAALNGKASAYFFLKRYEDARGWWARVLDLAPDDPGATQNMRTLVKMGY
jgi:tetratricopeptide (TPR) repeat protein